MKRTITALLLGVALVLLTSASAQAADCEFRLGFKTLRDLIGHDIVGECLENEHYNEISDSNQQTTGGLMAWRKADNWTAFTDGYRTWINGPNGLVQRLNTERFPWEADHIHTPPPTPGPAPAPAPAAVPRPTIDSTLAHAYHVMRNTPIGNKIADKFVQLGMSAVFGELVDSAGRYDTNNNRVIIDNDYRHEGYNILAKLLVWTTGGLILHEELGEMQSWGECMARMIVLEGFEAQYWLEAFGENGKSNPTEREQYANWDVEWYISEMGLRWVWMSEFYRDSCESYGDGPYIDPELARAYRETMWGENQLGIATVDAIVASGADVQFGSAKGEGYFSPSRNHIVVNESLRGQPKPVLATILIHETYHAQQNRIRGGRPEETAAACLQEEINAFRLEARWWYERYGRYGKRNPTRMESGMNNLLRAWINKDLKAWVLLSESYQIQCLGGVVE